MPDPNSLTFYNDSARAERYHRRHGFAPERTAKMREVLLDLLTALTPAQSSVLELGAGTGLFTEALLKAKHFGEIYATDGAAAMLEIARQTLAAEQAALRFILLDFTSDWPGQLAGIRFGAVTSSMALHHAQDKRRLFEQVFSMLQPQGVFVFADHMAGAYPWTERLLVRERALIMLGRKENLTPEQIQEMMDVVVERGRKEGNLCESVAQYQDYLGQCGFQDAECLWRDFWLAIFVARKPA